LAFGLLARPGSGSRGTRRKIVSLFRRREKLIFRLQESSLQKWTGFLVRHRKVIEKLPASGKRESPLWRLDSCESGYLPGME